MNKNEFDRSCKQLRKKYNFESSQEFLNELKDLFIKTLGQPEDMALELFDYCVPTEAFEDKTAVKMSDMTDLFLLDYDTNYNQLDDEDWDYLKELVNSWALDMDMDTVTYVMQQVVDAGAFH